jgi:hypothetical protein
MSMQSYGFLGRADSGHAYTSGPPLILSFRVQQARKSFKCRDRF